MKDTLHPPHATPKGRRYKLFADGDVFIFTKRQEDGSLDPISRTDENGEQVSLQFNNVKDAIDYVKRAAITESMGQTVVIAEIRRIFDVETEKSVKVQIKEKKRILALPKRERRIPVEIETMEA